MWIGCFIGNHTLNGSMGIVSSGDETLEFSPFSGEVSQSLREHIARFTSQCNEVVGNGYLKLRWTKIIEI